MKYCIHYMLLLLAISCKEKKSAPVFVSTASGDIIIEKDIVFQKQVRFTGVLFELNPATGDTLSSQEIRNGLPNGVSKKWYPNQQLMEYREYKEGRKNGKQLAYWRNGYPRFEFTAVNDACEGEMKEWSVNGRLYHIAHYTNGQEEGSQQMWYENGKIRANYVIIKGKRYGLLGTKNCKNVSDSVFAVK